MLYFPSAVSVSGRRCRSEGEAKMNGLLRSLGVLAIGCALLAGTACSGEEEGTSRPVPPKAQGGSSGGTKTDPQAKVKASAARKQLTECLRKEGFASVPPGNKKLSDKEQLAVQKCSMALLGGLSPSVKAQVDTLRNCMKKRGVSVPAVDQPFVPNIQDPKVAAAMKACQSKLSGS